MTFIPLPNFAERMSEDAEFQEHLAAALEPLKTLAEQLSPVGTGEYKGTFVGHYKDKFAVVVKDGEVFFTNLDWKAHFIEWGTASQPPQGVLRRAVLAAGLELAESE